MDSNETKNRVKKFIGFVGYGLLKRHLRNVKIKIDTEKKLVTIIRGDVKFQISFDEIEDLLNEQV